MQESPLPPSVFTYFDFRSFLKDRHKWLKSQKAVFTLEQIAQKLAYLAELDAQSPRKRYR